MSIDINNIWTKQVSYPISKSLYTNRDPSLIGLDKILQDAYSKPDFATGGNPASVKTIRPAGYLDDEVIYNQIYNKKPLGRSQYDKVYGKPSQRKGSNSDVQGEIVQRYGRASVYDPYVELEPYIDTVEFKNQQIKLNAQYRSQQGGIRHPNYQAQLEYDAAMKSLALNPPLKEGYVFDPSTFTLYSRITSPTATNFQEEIEYRKSKRSPIGPIEPTYDFFTPENLSNAYEDVRQQSEKRLMDINAISDPYEREAAYEQDIPLFVSKADEYTFQLENYEKLFLEKVDKEKSDYSEVGPVFSGEGSFNLEDLNKLYNDSVDQFNAEATKIESIQDPVKRQARIEEELPLFDTKVGEYKGYIDKYVDIYTNREPDIPKISVRRRDFGGVKQAEQSLAMQKAMKMKEIEATQDPIEKQVKMDQDLPYYVGIGLQLGQFKKALNFELTNYFTGISDVPRTESGPRVPSFSPSGINYLPKRGSGYNMGKLIKNPLEFDGGYSKDNGYGLISLSGFDNMEKSFRKRFKF